MDAPLTTVFGHEATSVFDYLGPNENARTYSIGCVLGRVPEFAEAFLRAVGIDCPVADVVEVRMQHPGPDGGFTDIEIVGTGFHVIFEAKRGWELPVEQLRKYEPRTRQASLRSLVALSACSHEYAKHQLAEAGASDIVALRWQEVLQVARQVKHEIRNVRGRFHLAELVTYLEGIIPVQNQTSNLAYVVSLGRAIEGTHTSFRDIVNNRGMYFHPFGEEGRKKGWPLDPPNYLAFRYDSRLQTIHHVEQWEVVDDLEPLFPELAGVPWIRAYPHSLYTLGEAIRPSSPVLYGPSVQQSVRVWAMLDLLLTSPTITDAMLETKRRQSHG